MVKVCTPLEQANLELAMGLGASEVRGAQQRSLLQWPRIIGFATTCGELLRCSCVRRRLFC